MMRSKAERGLQSPEDSEAVGGQRLSLASVINGPVALRLSSLHFLQDVVQRCGQHVEEWQRRCGEIFIPAVNLFLETRGEMKAAAGEQESCVIFTVFTMSRKGKANLVGSDLLSDYTQERDREWEREREQTVVSGVAACNDWVAPLAEVEVGPADINLKPIPASDSVCRRPIQLLAF